MEKLLRDQPLRYGVYTTSAQKEIRTRQLRHGHIDTPPARDTSIQDPRLYLPLVQAIMD